MPPKKNPLFNSFHTFTFRPESRTNSPNSGAGKALRSAVKLISQAPGNHSTYWARKLPDRDSVLLITTWSCENSEVEFFTSETWKAALNYLLDYLLSPIPTRDSSSGSSINIRFPQSHSIGLFRSWLTREHEIITFKFPINVAAESKSEFDSRVSNLVDTNNIGTVDPDKPRLKDFSGGWVSHSEDGGAVSVTYIALVSWDDEGQKERFKLEDLHWCHFWEKAKGLFEGVETERFGGTLKHVCSSDRARYNFESETEDDEDRA